MLWARKSAPVGNLALRPTTTFSMVTRPSRSVENSPTSTRWPNCFSSCGIYWARAARSICPAMSSLWPINPRAPNPASASKTTTPTPRVTRPPGRAPPTVCPPARAAMGPRALPLWSPLARRRGILFSSAPNRPSRKRARRARRAPEREEDEEWGIN